jgi:hypothetical protein
VEVVSAPTTSTTIAPSTTIVATTEPSTSSSIAPASGGPSTSVPIDPAQLIPVTVGNKPFPGPGDELAAEFHGFSGDPNATLQVWKIMPMAVPSGPDVRLLGFERSVGINTTTASFLVGSIDPQTALTNIAAALAPSPTYTTTQSTRTEGTTTIFVLDAQPTTVEGDPPGWSIEASSVDELGVVRIKRSDYTFEQTVPTFDDLPAQIQSDVTIEDAIAVNAGGRLSSISYNAGVESLGDPAVQRTRLTYDVAADMPTAADALTRLLTVGWDKSEQTDAIYFTSANTPEVWTVDSFGGTTHFTYDTGG